MRASKLLSLILLAAPLALAAQGRPGGAAGPRPGPMPHGDAMPRAGAMREAPMPRAGGVTQILNARRVLDLTPRQVAQLDSIERVLWAEREKVRAQVAPMRDSMQARMRRGDRPDSAERAAMRRANEERMARVRPQIQALQQRDSTARVAAERILTEAQRGKWREIQAERRGFERGMREGRGRLGRAMMQAPHGGQQPRRPH